jgi:hypothetical protein
MENAVSTVYDPELNAHLATINPPLAAVTVTVHVDRYDEYAGLSELFLYSFDVDSNCIEFAFGERVQHVEDKRYVTYDTDPLVHVPPFRIQIMHQVQGADLSRYAFTVSYQLMF